MTQTEIFSFVVQTLYWFFLYGCIGWGVEVVYAAIKERRLVNRGFLCGPICPIYGCGMVVLNWTVAALAPSGEGKSVSTVAVFFVGMVLTTAIELVGGWTLFKIYHIRWWDYSNMKFNIGGYICPQFSLLWGLGSVIMVKVVHPALAKASSPLPMKVLVPAEAAVLALFVVDLIVSAAAATGLNKKLKEIDEVRARLRAIPSVNELLAEWPVVKAVGETCDAVVHAAVTAELDEERAAIRAGAAPRSKRELASAIEFRAHRSALPSLRPAVNATGVVIHTNLGRAPLAESAAKAVAEVARGYSTLEYSVDTCSRGSRKEHAAQLIRSLTGAEDALVVNNNAAAVLLVLATHAAGKEVIVSRGELVEIGGSFRIPDVMAASGAKLVEVGATNRTHLSDYERAITPDTAMILKVHPSNYRIEGFHEEVGSRELAALAHKHGLLFYEDQGSGALLPDDILVRGGEETTPASVAAGLDLVSCSGDKLLGAAQAGIIMGRRDLVQACGSHPLMRALRPGKLALTALEATLRIYMDGADVAHREVPVLNMLTLPQAHLERRARKLRELMVAGLDKAGCPCAVQVEIVEESSTPGGGSLPTVELPTMCVAVRLVDARLTVDALKRSLVQDFDTPVVTRTSHDRILFDVRTLVGDRDIETAASTLVACVKKAIAR